MTYWYHAYCRTCSSASPPLFVTTALETSLYCIDEQYRVAAMEWLGQHCCAPHDVALVHEDDSRHPGPPLRD